MTKTPATADQVAHLAHLLRLEKLDEPTIAAITNPKWLTEASAAEQIEELMAKHMRKARKPRSTKPQTRRQREADEMLASDMGHGNF